MTAILFLFITIISITLFLIIRDEIIYSYNKQRTIRICKKTRKVQHKINQEWTDKL